VSGNAKLGADVTSFFAGVVKLGALARAQGHFDAEGDPIWSIPIWEAFCRGARAYKHAGSFYGPGLVNTVHEVEEMIADQYDAASIHAVLKGFEYEREAKNRRRDPHQIHYAELGS
jgi:hypothetical protein